MADAFKQAVEDLVGELLDASVDSLPGWIRSTLKNSIVEEATTRLKDRVQAETGLEPEEALKIVSKGSETLVQDMKGLLTKSEGETSKDYGTLAALILLSLPSALKKRET